MSTAIVEILAERFRQVSQEGWSPEHDDQHNDGALACAAACYAAKAEDQQKDRPTLDGFPPGFWPWDEAWWNPADPRRNLIKAAALVLAEIERLDRATAKETEAPEPEQVWSNNGEEFSFDSLPELIEDSEAALGETVYVGTKRPFTASCFIRADEVIEMMGERAFDEAGEFSDGFPNTTNSAHEQLDHLLKAWADHHGSVGFFLVEDVQEHVLTESDMES